MGVYNIKPHPLLEKFVKDVMPVVGIYEIVYCPEHLQNYMWCWGVGKPCKSYGEVHKIVIYGPVPPSYCPRNMHSRWMTVTLTEDMGVIVKFHDAMGVEIFTDILKLLRQVERKWIREMKLKESISGDNS